MFKVHPITLLAFFLLGGVAYVSVTDFMWSREPGQPLTAEPIAAAAPIATTAPSVAATPIATPEPIVTAQPILTAQPIAIVEPVVTAEPIATAEPVVTAEPISTAEPVPSIATIPEVLPVEPQPAAPTFFTVDTTLYARDNARLRTAPSTTADVLTTLAADAPLHAIKRSTDGTWWQVSVAGGRIGYVSRAAVSKNRIVKAKPNRPVAAPAPVVVAAAPAPVPTRASQGVLEAAMTWFTVTAAQGKATEAKPTER